MPVPLVPRRAAPPRKKSSQKQTPPVETEAIASSFEKGTSIHDSSDTPSESHSALTPVPGDIEPEVRATDPDVDPSDLADKNLEPTEQSLDVTVPPIHSSEAGSTPAPPKPASSPLDPQPEWLDNPEVDPSPMQVPDDVAEPTVPSIPTVSLISQEETEVEEVAPHAGDDEALVAAEEEEDEDGTERVAKMGEDPPYISSGVVAVESHPTASTVSSESIPYSVFQQGGGATAVNEEDDDGNDGKY